MLKREGWSVGENQVYRLYRLEGLQLRMKVKRPQAHQREWPKAITVHNGTEFTSKALDKWAWRRRE